MIKEKLLIEKLLDTNLNKENARCNQLGKKINAPMYLGQSFADILPIEESTQNYFTFTSSNNLHSDAENNPKVGRDAEMLPEQALKAQEEAEATPIPPQTPLPQKLFIPQECSTIATIPSQLSTTTINAIDENYESCPEMLFQYNLATTLLKDVSHNGDPLSSLNAICLTQFGQTLQQYQANLKNNAICLTQFGQILQQYKANLKNEEIAVLEKFYLQWWEYTNKMSDILTIEDLPENHLTSNNNPHSYTKNDPNIGMSSDMFVEKASQVIPSPVAESLAGAATTSAQPRTPSPDKPFSVGGCPPTIPSPMSITTKIATEENSVSKPEMLLQYCLPISLLKDVSHTGNPEISLNAICLNHFWHTLQKNKAHLKDEEKAALVDLFKLVGHSLSS